MFLIERTVTIKDKTTYQAMLYVTSLLRIHDTVNIAAALRCHARKNRRILKLLAL